MFSSKTHDINAMSLIDHLIAMARILMLLGTQYLDCGDPCSVL